MTADRRTWAWRQNLPAEEKLALLALIEADDRIAAADARPDPINLADRIEEAGQLAGTGTRGTSELVKRLQMRGLVKPDGSVPAGEQLAI